MTSQTSHSAAPGKGILFYVLGIVSMATMDLFAKTLAQDVHVAQVVWSRYAGQTLIVLIWFAPKLGAVMRTRYPGLQFLRGLALLFGTSMFFLSLTFLGLAEATAIMDINPIIITLGAALLLGERLGPRRAFGVVAALIGALIIIRPGSDVFSPAAILPLCAATGYATFILITRKVGHDEDSRTSLLYSALLGAVIMSFIVPFFWTMPTVKTAILMIAIGGCGALGQLFLVKSVKYAEASAIAPFSYVGLLVAAFWGAVIFDEFPDMATWIGGAIIVASGIYVWHRERVSAQGI